VSDDARYPIGRFTAPTGLDATGRRAALVVLAELPVRIGAAVAGLDDTQLDTPYRAGGWTVRQVVHHVADSHLNAVIRIRLALTEERPTIRPYDEKRWAELADAATLPVAPSLRILEGLHQRWVALLESLDEADWDRELLHPEFDAPLPIWSVVALYDWHCRHHVAHITRLRAREGW
jgi:hypothetical protein